MRTSELASAAITALVAVTGTVQAFQSSFETLSGTWDFTDVNKVEGETGTESRGVLTLAAAEAVLMGTFFTHGGSSGEVVVSVVDNFATVTFEEVAPCPGMIEGRRTSRRCRRKSAARNLTVRTRAAGRVFRGT
jgi:hypothetical protein